MAFRGNPSGRTRLPALLCAGLWLLACCTGALAEDMPEYRLKAAVLYNFVLFTEWPGVAGDTLRVCIHGGDPFGAEIDSLEGQPVGSRRISIRHNAAAESLSTCQVVFIASPAMPGLAQLLPALQGAGALTVADSPGAARQGVILNMTVAQNKVAFEANVEAARKSKLNLSSKLLHLATEVYR